MVDSVTMTVHECLGVVVCWAIVTQEIQIELSLDGSMRKTWSGGGKYVHTAP